MEALGMIALIAVAGGLAIWGGLRQAKHWRQALQVLAESWDLTVEPGSWKEKASAAGRRGRLGIEISTYHVHSGNSGQDYTRVRVKTGLLGRITLAKEGITATIGKAFKGADIETGLTEFDDRFLIRGRDDAEVLAFLDSGTRAAMSEAIQARGAKLDDDGDLTWEAAKLETNALELDGVLTDLVALAEALQAAVDDPAERLADHVERDPEPRFRARCLEALCGGIYRKTAATRRALEAGKKDRSLEVRVRAAVLADDVDGVLGVAELQRSGRSRHVSTRVMTARALRLSSVAEREGLLLALLGDDAAAVKIAAAEALEHVGSLAAVEPLLDAADGFLTDRDVKQAARAAVTAIQGRGGGESGGLTVVDDVAATSGAVTLAEEALAGALSAAEAVELEEPEAAVEVEELS